MHFFWEGGVKTFFSGFALAVDRDLEVGLRNGRRSTAHEGNAQNVAVQNITCLAAFSRRPSRNGSPFASPS